MSLPTYQDYYPYILKNGDIEKTADQYLELIMTEMDVPKSEQEIKHNELISDFVDSRLFSLTAD